MGRALILIGVLLILAPFVVMGGEVLWAELQGHTGETRMAAGQWGLFLGVLTLPLGAIALLIGVLTR
jgi:hypothetical protein